jgi:CheY-like chemotaxis protein
MKAIKAGGIDLLIVDIFMPGMDGIETIREVRQHQPDLPAIVISGTSLGGTDLHAPGLQAPDFLAMAVKLGAVRSLQKPFKPRDIITAVDQCLGGAAEKQTGTG